MTLEGLVDMTAQAQRLRRAFAVGSAHSLASECMRTSSAGDVLWWQKAGAFSVQLSHVEAAGMA